MLSRLDFYELDEDLKKMGFEISEISEKADEFITCLVAIENTFNTIYKIEMIRKAEMIAREMIQLIIPKINPDLNRLIWLDNQDNISYKELINSLGLIQNKIEKEKENLINKLLNKEGIDTNKITNKIILDFYSSYLHNVVNDIVFNPLREAFFKFFRFSRIKIIVTDEIRYFSGKIIEIKKDETLFWYLVYSFLLRASQVLGFIPESQRVLMRQPFDIKDLNKLIAKAQRQAVSNYIQTKKDQEGQDTEKKEIIIEEKQEERGLRDEDIGEESDEDEEEYEVEDTDEISEEEEKD